jgi:hypothetical protein
MPLAEHESNRIRNHDSYTTPGGTIQKPPVKVVEDSPQGRLVEAAIIVQPSSQNGVVSLCQLVQAGGGFPRHLPLAHLASHPCDRSCTHRRQEAGLRSPTKALGSDTSRPKRKPKERKLYPRVDLPPPGILAVHDTGFLRMHLQLALLQPNADGRQQRLCLALALAVRHGIIGISGKWDERVCRCIHASKQ